MVFGSWRARWSSAKSSVVRFSGDRLKLAAFATVAAGVSSHSAAGLSITAEMLSGVAERVDDGLGVTHLRFSAAT